MTVGFKTSIRCEMGLVNELRTYFGIIFLGGGDMTILRFFLAIFFVTSIPLLADDSGTPAGLVTPIRGGFSAPLEGYQFKITFFNGIPEIAASYVQIDVNKKILNQVLKLYVSAGVSKAERTQILSTDEDQMNASLGQKFTHKYSDVDFWGEKFKKIESFDSNGVLIFSSLENSQQTFTKSSSIFDTNGKIESHQFYYRYRLDGPFDSARLNDKQEKLTTIQYLLKKYPGYNLNDPDELEKFCEKVFDEVVLGINNGATWSPDNDNDPGHNN